MLSKNKNKTRHGTYGGLTVVVVVYTRHACVCVCMCVIFSHAAFCRFGISFFEHACAEDQKRRTNDKVTHPRTKPREGTVRTPPYPGPRPRASQCPSPGTRYEKARLNNNLSTRHASLKAKSSTRESLPDHPSLFLFPPLLDIDKYRQVRAATWRRREAGRPQPRTPDVR
ncbi:hypothetical protein F5Y02DRAFT_149027 [Annulohypoxylon stygium]|nr:hypothetical protein F5Y02DRAFT_149027 [Annulohypoxylon stygium]